MLIRTPLLTAVLAAAVAAPVGLTATPAGAAPPAPLISALAGTGQSGYSGDGGLATSARTSAVEDVVRDRRGTTWIADTYNNAVRTVDSRGVITTFVGPEAGLNLPFDLALDPRGRLYVADTYNNRIVRFDAPGAAPVVLLDGLRFPFGVDVTPDGRVLVADTFANRVVALELDGSLTTIADSSTPVEGVAVRIPYDVTASGDAVLIADTGRHRVVQARDGVLTRVAGTGVAGFSGDAGPADAAQLWSPSGIDARPNGSFAVADFRNNRVRLVDVRGEITTIAGNGTAGSSGDGGPATAASINIRGGVSLSEDGRTLVLADTFASRVRSVQGHGPLR